MRDEKEDVGRGNSALGGLCSAELLFVDAWLKSVLFDRYEEVLRGSLMKWLR